ncbi:MAG: hypothetical protein H6622_00725 [Halobacteriovoraceae bacterium]|nr:hypothetical protein [Halobacteriovoraceae bacterium]
MSKSLFGINFLFPYTKVTICQALMMNTLVHAKKNSENDSTKNAIEKLKNFRREILQKSEVKPLVYIQRFDELDVDNFSQRIQQVKVKQQIEGIIRNNEVKKSNELEYMYGLVLNAHEMKSFLKEVDNWIKRAQKNYIERYHNSLDTVFNIVFPMQLPFILNNSIDDPLSSGLFLGLHFVMAQLVNAYALPKDWMINRDKFYFNIRDKLEDKSFQWQYFSKVYQVTQHLVRSSLEDYPADEFLRSRFEDSVTYNNEINRNSKFVNYIFKKVHLEKNQGDFFNSLSKLNTVAFDILVNKIDDSWEYIFILRIMKNRPAKILPL